ncbi:MAG TPA: hypothetical protein VF077_03955 [Nitrospiraceae bacterium]
MRKLAKKQLIEKRVIPIKNNAPPASFFMPDTADKSHTTAHELDWLRSMYKAGKFQELLNLREVYKKREWRGDKMLVDSYKIIDALEGMCETIEKITGVKEGGKVVILKANLKSGMTIASIIESPSRPVLVRAHKDVK